MIIEQIKNTLSFFKRKQSKFQNQNTFFYFFKFKITNFFVFDFIILGNFISRALPIFFLSIFHFVFSYLAAKFIPHFIITRFTPFSFHFNTLFLYPFTLLKYPKHSKFSDNSCDYIHALFCILIHQTYVPNTCSFTIYFL